jgi:hypothetical protein
MKHAEMMKLMGRMVLVRKVLEREKGIETRKVTMPIGPLGVMTEIEEPVGMRAWWEEKEIEPRTGWVAGFRHLQEGYV